MSERAAGTCSSIESYHPRRWYDRRLHCTAVSAWIVSGATTRKKCALAAMSGRELMHSCLTIAFAWLMEWLRACRRARASSGPGVRAGAGGRGAVALSCGGWRVAAGAGALVQPYVQVGRIDLLFFTQLGARIDRTPIVHTLGIRCEPAKPLMRAEDDERVAGKRIELRLGVHVPKQPETPCLLMRV